MMEDVAILDHLRAWSTFLGAEVVESPCPPRGVVDAAGCFTVVRERGHEDRPIIWVQSGRTLTERTWTTAHELGHFVDHLLGEGGSMRQREATACWFASALMALLRRQYHSDSLVGCRAKLLFLDVLKQSVERVLRRSSWVAEQACLAGQGDVLDGVRALGVERVLEVPEFSEDEPSSVGWQSFGRWLERLLAIVRGLERLTDMLDWKPLPAFAGCARTDDHVEHVTEERGVPAGRQDSIPWCG